VLAVPTTPDSIDHWKTAYVKAFEKEWQVHIPERLLDVLSGTNPGGHVIPHVLALRVPPLIAALLADVFTYEDSTVRLALLLLWVRRHVVAPFWQQWVLPEEHTASGPAWGTEALSQLQWSALQVSPMPFKGTGLSSSLLLQ